MPYTFDATLKDMLAPDPVDLVPAFGLPRDEPAVARNVDLSTLSAATDVVIGFGMPLKEIVDLNFQSGLDTYVDAPYLVYAVEYVQGDNWLGVALSALMRIPRDRVAWLGAEALRRSRRR